jgi:hypothetical protein
LLGKALFVGPKGGFIQLKKKEKRFDNLYSACLFCFISLSNYHYDIRLHFFLPFLEKGNGLNRAALGQPLPWFLAYALFCQWGYFVFSNLCLPTPPPFSGGGNG